MNDTFLFIIDDAIARGDMEFVAGNIDNVKTRWPNAAFNHSPQIIQYVIDHGVDVEKTVGQNGKTALCLAAEYGAIDAVRVLLANGADVNRVADGSTPLHHASKHTHWDVIELLLAHGASHSARDHAGKSPLHVAARLSDFIDSMSGDQQERSARTIEVLLAHGANIDATDNDGDRPIHMAADVNNVAGASVLIKNGANLLGDGERTSPAGLAAINDCGEILDMMIEAGVDVMNDANITINDIIMNCRAVNFLKAVDGIPADIMASMLNHQRSLRDVNRLSKTSQVLSAISSGSSEMLRAVIMKGGNPSGDDAVDLKPIHAAVMHEKPDVIDVLVESGVDIEVVNHDSGLTPLRTAIQLHRPQALSRLIHHGADRDGVIDLIDKSSSLGDKQKDELKSAAIAAISAYEVNSGDASHRKQRRSL